MSAFRTGFQLAKTPCPVCWEKLDKFVPIHGGRSGQCHTCDNFWKAVPISVGSGRPCLSAGAYDFQKNDEDPRFVHVLRFSLEHFPRLSDIQERLLQEDSVLCSLPDICPYKTVRAEGGRAVYLRFTDSRSGPCRVVRLEPGMYAVCKSTRIYKDKNLTIEDCFSDYYQLVEEPTNPVF